MAYATLADVRAAGITLAMATDEQVTDLLDEVCLDIDRYTQWFFEPRTLTVTMDGRGVKTLEPPYPPIEITSLVHEEESLSVDPDDLHVLGSPVGPEFLAPRIVRLHPSYSTGSRQYPRTYPVFVKGIANITLVGRWGYTVEDPLGDPEGRTPPAIKRATLLMVNRLLPSITDADSAADAAWWRIAEMRTQDQAVRYAEQKPSHAAFTGSGGAGPFTGDPTIDEILLRYMKPPGLGAV